MYLFKDIYLHNLTFPVVLMCQVSSICTTILEKMLLSQVSFYGKFRSKDDRILTHWLAPATESDCYRIKKLHES